jgi:predicted glycosyltransferase
MNIVVDIGHPAHVHFFKYFIWEIEKRGHIVLITATNKDVTLRLLDAYGFKYINLGSYGKTSIKKALNIPLMDIKMYKRVKSFKPDLFLGITPVRGSHVAAMLKKPCIAFDDTEHSKYEIFLYKPFVKTILTPNCFIKNLGKKQIRYQGFHELAYLHPNYFKPDSTILNKICITEMDIFFILRFVSWSAGHDAGQHGLTLEGKRRLIQKLSTHGRVLITSEGPLPKEFEGYHLNIEPELFHHVLSRASLCISEGGTTATEAAVLGVPTIHISTLAKHCGNFRELQERYGLLFHEDNEKVVIEMAIAIINQENIKQRWAIKRGKLLEDKIDLTSFMVDLISRWPESFENIKRMQSK